MYYSIYSIEKASESESGTKKKTFSCVLILILFFSLNGKSTEHRKTNNE